MGDTDRIEKKVMLRAPRARVWRAISDAAEFGSWFGVKLDGPFVAGGHAVGVVAPTAEEAEAGKPKSSYDGMKFDLTVDRIEPERLFSFRWHPFAVDPAVDYSKEPTTLVVFSLEEVPGGTMLTVTETGFDGVPLARRAKAFAMNDGGWGEQMQRIEKHLARAL